MEKLKLGDTIAYDETMIDYQLIPQDFGRFVGKLVLMDDEAVGAETPSWLEVVQLVTYHYNGDVTIMTDEGSQTISKHKLVKHSGNYIAFYAVKEVPAETAVIDNLTALTTQANQCFQIADMAIMQGARILYHIKKNKLYKQNGYSNFEEYCKAEVKISLFQARKYAQIAENATEETASQLAVLGVEKTYLLTMLDEPDRKALIENYDVENMTVKELKEAKAEIQKLKKETAERYLMMQSEISELADAYNELESEKSSLEEQNAKLEEARRSKHQEWLSAMDEITSLTVQKTRLEERVQELENRPPETVTQTLYTDNPQKEAEIQSLSQDLQQANAEIEQLQRALQQTQEAHPQNGKNGELDAHFKIFRDALSHIVAILGNPETPDFLRKQYLSSLTTTFEKYTSIFADDDKKEAPKPKKESKHKYGEYGYVKLTETEYNRLVSEYGEKIIREYIIKVDNYCKSNNNKQKYSDYNLILRDWLRRDNVSKISKEGEANGNPWYLRTI